MKRTVNIQSDTAVALTLIDHYDRPYPWDNPLELSAEPASGVAAFSLDPTDAFPLSLRYRAENAAGQIGIFVLPAADEAINADLLGGFVGQHGWRWLDGLTAAWEFPGSLIDRMDSHMSGNRALRPYEERLYSDFDAYENGELIRPDLAALDEKFVTLSGGPL